ncbi:MAG: extracellular solute-binding protein [Rhodobacterales bacterium]|nr:extracellular solute-binding protein [Rhodobacterales bacterium]
MKHLLAVTALATGILASLPGLAQDKTVVSFLHKFPEPENMAYFDAAVAEFEAANPTIDIVMEAVADEPYKDKIRVLMASDQVPDIYFSWSGEFGRKFAREGRTLDLTEALKGPEWQGRFAAASLEPFQFEGKQFGIPVNVDSKYMIYNKAVFEKHGLAVPTTFAEFIALNDALLAAGEVPIAYGNQSPWAATHYIGDLFAKMVPDDVRQADYQLLAPADQLYTHPGYVEALALYKSFGDKGYFNNGANAISHQQARGAFIAGRSAMVYLELVEFYMLADTPVAEQGWGFFPLPPMEGAAGRNDLLTGAPDGFLISAKTEHPEEALAFLNFITSPDQAAKYVSTTGMTSAVIGSVTEQTTTPETLAGLKALEDAAGMALWLDTDMDTASANVILAAGQGLLSGDETPEAVMEKVRAAAKETLAQR